MWQDKGTWIIEAPKTIIQIPFVSRIALKITDITDQRPTWNYAGWVKHLVEIDPIGLSVVEAKHGVSARMPSVIFPPNFASSYQLEFTKNDWIDALKLTIYEDSMLINYPIDPFSVPSQLGGTATNTLVPITTASVVALAANSNRKSFSIENNTNQIMYIEYGATASAAVHRATIPAKTPGGLPTIFTNDTYNGQVSIIWAATGTGAALVGEVA
jgi:hypothetical protein